MLLHFDYPAHILIYGVLEFTSLSFYLALTALNQPYLFTFDLFRRPKYLCRYPFVISGRRQIIVDVS